MDKTTEDAPAEVTSPEGQVSFDDQHFCNGRHSSSGVSIKTECTASRSTASRSDDQTFSFAHTAMLKESDSFSTTEDALRNSQISSGVSKKTENAPSKDHVSETVFEDESEKPVSIVDLLSKNQSSSVSTKALPSTTSCSIDLSSIEEIIALVNGMAERSESAPSLDGESNASTSAEQFQQPPKKKTKLSRSIQVPVKDLFSGVHTSLCKHDCTLKHNPLVLAICVPDEHELKDYLENHWRLVITTCWKSAQYSTPKLIKHWVTQLVHLTVLFGKYNLLKILLRIHLDSSELYVDSSQNSPLHTIFKSLHHYMPFSSHQEKLLAFQSILCLFAKYNRNVLLVRDMPYEDTILHVCAKKIKELTYMVRSIQSHGHDELKLQGLLNQRQLLEGMFKELIHTLKRLCVDGSLHHNQVIELFDCANNVGETMSQILKEEESARNNSVVLASQVALTPHEEGNTEENLENVMTEEDISQLSTVASSSASSTAQNENAHVLTQAAIPSGTETNHLSVVSTESLSIRTTHVATSCQTENSTGTITLSANCSSVHKSLSTTESTSLRPEQSVKNSSESTILSTECQLSAASVTVPSKTVVSGAQTMSTMLPGNTVRQQSGKHTFLCSQDCTLKHHKLVELLCATPDHLSTDTATAEGESCADLKDYLIKSHWVISEVVPSLEPRLRLPIVHLACLLGKHKALEVLSEFGFHALLRTADTEETPLHMTVQLLRYQTSNGIFLSDVVVNIVKTLNQHIHPISLFSAKDAKGNSVLHAMAELISSNVPKATTLLYVYVFRVFVQFLMKERQYIPKSGSLQILSNCLKECNKAGQDVKSLLQKSVHGKQLLEYLDGLMQKGRPETPPEKIVEARKDSHEYGNPKRTCTFQKQREISKEPNSLVDFILSADCKISSASKERIVEFYVGEYESRLQLVTARVAAVREEMALAEMSLEQNMIGNAKLRMMESEVNFNEKRMKLREGELKKKQREQVLLNKRLQLLGRLQRIVNERKVSTI